MDKKSKLILALLLFIVVLLALFVAFISYKVATIESSINNLASQKQVLPKVINGTNGVDGVNGVSIKGEIGDNGRDGKDSHSTNTVIERNFYTPVVGPEGKPGKDGASSELRLNPETKDLEAKSNKDKFWNTLIPCSDLMRVCPGEIIEEAIGKK